MGKLIGVFGCILALFLGCAWLLYDDGLETAADALAEAGIFDTWTAPNGDTVVMVSDGITDGREESRELFELLRSRVLTHSADQLADVIIEYADRIGCVDDVSVVVAKIDDGIF